MVAKLTRDEISPQFADHWHAAHQAGCGVESLGECGARVVFEGIVRQKTGDLETEALEYDCHEPMALVVMERLEREAEARFGLKSAFVVHRLGKLAVGETSIVAIVASAHRAEAFAGCAWLMDEVKKRVPIWKKEIGPKGETWRHPTQGILKPSSPGEGSP